MTPYSLSLLTFLLSLGFYSTHSSNQESGPSKITDNVKIKISFNDTAITATLYDNATAHDFISLMPLTTTLKDYANNELIFYPERKLNTDGAPDGYTPSKGDITYYAPWGDVALFYRDFKYAEGLISLGKMKEADIDLLRDATEVTFEVVD